MLVRRNETFPPVTMAHIRGHGCRDLLIYCGSINCNHSATMNGDWLAEDVHVRSLCQRMVCTKCGMIGADVLFYLNDPEHWRQRAEQFIPKTCRGSKLRGVLT